MNSTMRPTANIFTKSALMLGLLCIVLAAPAQTQFTNEFWVCNTTNTANRGTLSDPFDGSTHVKFDSVLNNLPPYATLHILGGTYMTLGASYVGAYRNVKPGQKILGSGVDVTILVLTNAPELTDDFAVFEGPGSGIEISDLTCDVNYT